MPMGEKPDSLVDWSGKLKALPSVRIVDASSLMRIKAGSHTFMAMANAHRIAQSVD
jgi:choline dehydrogenase-like flavoprotein